MRAFSAGEGHAGSEPSLGVLPYREARRRLLLSLRARLIQFNARTPSQLLVDPAAASVVCPDRVALEWPNALLVHVAGAAGEADRPHARTVTEDAARRGILFLAAPGGRVGGHRRVPFLVRALIFVFRTAFFSS